MTETTTKDTPETNPMIEGTIFMTRKGIGYVSSEQFEDDIEISADQTKTAFHGDTVRIKLLPKTDTRRQGVVEEIISRLKTHFVGTIKEEAGTYTIAPDDARIQKPFTIENAKDAEVGYKVYGEVVSWGDSTNAPTLRILETLGKKGDHETETRALLLSRNIDTSFPKDVEKEAEDIRENHTISLENRIDIRDRTTCTIDPHDAKDFDDALSVKTLESNWYEIGIHIADVSHFVRPGTALDREAQERALSVYLVDRTIPMLPEALSNDLCSLNPNEDKVWWKK